MSTQEYLIAWIIYLIAGIGFSILSWRFLKKCLWRELAYLLQCLLVALIFTPWYVLPEEEILAPALMVFVMDLVTVDLESSIRSLIPLVMAMLLGLVVTAVLSVVYRIRGRKLRANIIED